VNLGKYCRGEWKRQAGCDDRSAAFGMIVTAELIFGDASSNKVIAENVVKQGTKGFEERIDAKFDVLEGSSTRSIFRWISCLEPGE